MKVNMINRKSFITLITLQSLAQNNFNMIYKRDYDIFIFIIRLSNTDG